ncbi:MAG: alpha-xylosidase [Aeriscardovia aeriphila]|nr:alpha-xylosidase [Aeriscardovia aeriphila]
MKFLNGEWLVEDGFEAKYAANIYTSRREGDKLVLFAPFNSPIRNAGMTLDGGILTIEVSSPRENIITTRLVNFALDRSHEPTFPLNADPENKVVIEEDDNEYRYRSGKLTLHVGKGDVIDFSYEYDGKRIAHSGFRSMGLVTDPEGKTHVLGQMDLGVDEKIYGMGERFTNFVKNGQQVIIWNRDGGTDSDQSYKNIPFYLSNRNYGLFVQDTGRVEFEVGTERVSRVQFSLEDQEMTYSVVGGSSMKDVLTNYTALTGRAPLLADWTFGLWLSTSFTTDYNEKTVLEFVDGMLDRGIPLSCFHFDCRWMKELEWCNFQWDEDKFPDPEGLLRHLHERGVKACVWINSYIGQKSPLFKEGQEKGYFIKRTNGQVWQWDRWQAGMAIVDFTNPEAVEWYKNQLRHLMDQGVDCFKTDFGERIPTEDVVYYDGSDPVKMHNYYTYLYNKAVYEVMQERNGSENAILFARSATAGTQKFPIHWGGDCHSTYPAMAESLRAGLSFGMSGFGYWSHDIAGFEDKPTQDIYKRWTQFGLLSSHSRYHGSTAYKVPWLFGDEAVEVSREFTRLKLRLVPYLTSQAKITHETGVPMMRAMALEFQDDPACEDIDTQYMLGSDLLVAPIFREDSVARFYVPDAGGDHAGQAWTNLLTGKSYEPGHWYAEFFDYHTLPLLVRPGAELKMLSEDDIDEQCKARGIATAEEGRRYAEQHPAVDY